FEGRCLVGGAKSRWCSRIRRSFGVISRRFAVSTPLFPQFKSIFGWFHPRQLHREEPGQGDKLWLVFFFHQPGPIRDCCAPQSSKPTSLLVGDGVSRLKVCAEAVSTVWRYRGDPGGRA